MPKYDLHVHTSLSSCAKPEASAAGYIALAKEMGLTTIAFTDHLWDSAIPGASDWYKPQNFEHICQLKKELPAADPSLKILFGCETECDMHGTVGVSEEVAAQLDVLLVPNSHTHMRFVMDRALREDDAAHGLYMVKHFMQIMESPLAKYITAVPHPFSAVGCPHRGERGEPASHLRHRGVLCRRPGEEHRPGDQHRLLPRHGGRTDRKQRLCACISAGERGRLPVHTGQ